MPTTIPDDERLQKLFQMLDGGGTPHEIANAVGMINRHLAVSGKRLKDLTLTEKTAPPSVEEVQARTARVLEGIEKDKRLEKLYEAQIAYAHKRQHEAEIQRDVLATFVSDRVAEVAARSAQGLIERIEAGEDVSAKFGRPAWATKVSTRKRWREWFHH